MPWHWAPTRLIVGKGHRATLTVYTPERLQQAIRGGELPDVLVAHNFAFERLLLVV